MFVRKSYRVCTACIELTSCMILEVYCRADLLACMIASVQYTQGIYNRPGIKCKNGRLEIASQIIDRFYLVDLIFAEFFLLDESCIYFAHVGT